MVQREVLHLLGKAKAGRNIRDACNVRFAVDGSNNTERVWVCLQHTWVIHESYIMHVKISTCHPSYMIVVLHGVDSLCQRELERVLDFVAVLV